MSAFDSFPLGRPAFVNNILDRAAHLRRHDDKLLAFEGHPATRAYVVHR
ncbi:MAG: NADH pyrophosphatase, partial [Bradyrhizobium sp.]|nr:NADH pyrophosphatase [Bradyrhizobium sp.]